MTCLQRPHGVVQLRTPACPTNFTNDPEGGVRVLVPEQPRGTVTLRLPNQGIVRCPLPLRIRAYMHGVHISVMLS